MVRGFTNSIVTRLDFTDITPQIARVALGYKYHAPPGFVVIVQNWIEQALRFLYEWLLSLRIMAPGLTDFSFASRIMQAVLCLAGVGCLVMIFYVFFTRWQTILAKGDQLRHGEISSTPLLNAADWLSESKRLAAFSNFKEACRAAYFASLHLIDENQILAFSPSRTNYEYYRALGRGTKIADTFHTLIDRQENIWFGSKTATEADYLVCSQAFEQIRSELENATG